MSRTIKHFKESSRYYWNVQFPTLKKDKRKHVKLAGELIQKEHSHDVFIVTLKLNNLSQKVKLTAGDPVELYWGTSKNESEWYGYVYSVERTTQPTHAILTVTCVGMSFYMKNQSQRIMKNVTADKFAKKIAKVHGLKAKVSKHPRVFPMISQAGQSDWQTLVRLASQCGYAFRVENGTLIFKSYKELYEESKRKAVYYNYVDTPSNALASHSEVYYFKPLLAEKGPDLDGASLKREMSIVNKNGNVKKTSHKPKYKKYNFSDSSVSRYLSENPDPIFKKIITDEVSISAPFSKNVLSSRSIDEGYRYQATAYLAGNPQIRPYDVIYIGDSLTFHGYWVIMEVTHKFGGNRLYETKVKIGSEFLNESFIQGPKSNTRELKVENPKEINNAKLKYTLEDSRVLNKIGREIDPGKNSYVGDPLKFYGVDYSTEMYHQFAPNFSQYSDVPKWRVQ